MATCRECLHQELCDTYSRMGVTDVPADDITICELFKPKNDYVKRERGEWVSLEPEIGLFGCSLCGHRILRTECNFCPDCGADMRKEDNNENSLR